MNEVQINKIKKRADEYATSCFPYEKQFLEREAIVKCCVHVVIETIAELEKQIAELEKENAELRKVAEFQQSSNINKYFENKKLKEGLEVGSTFNKALNSMNKNLEEERDKYRNMVFDKDEQLTKAKEILERLLITSCNSDVLNLLPNCSEVLRVRVEAEQFIKE